MIRLIATTLAASALIASPLVQAAEIEIEAEGPVIELSISESIKVAPDIATVVGGVSTEAPTAVEAMRQNAVEMRKVIDQIKALGVDEKDIQTTGIDLSARYDYDNETRKRTFRGYQVSNMVSVILRDIDATGGVLDAMIVAGANDVAGPSFSIEDDTAAKEKARERAVKRGMERAEAYARMLGYDEVKVLEINETISRSSYDSERLFTVYLDEAVSEAAPVQPGQISSGVTLTIKYEVMSDEEEGEEEGD
ncbi:MAG: SIMPL domain-containing protein [Pseudomonadota bacterium]